MTGRVWRFACLCCGQLVLRVLVGGSVLATPASNTGVADTSGFQGGGDDQEERELCGGCQVAGCDGVPGLICRRGRSA
jgi:hypothetical protein